MSGLRTGAGRRLRRGVLSVVAAGAVVAGAACTRPATPAGSKFADQSPVAASSATVAPERGARTVGSPAPAHRAVRPLIVLDPGHSPAISDTDPTTGLDDSDYENEPEMRDVYTVALLVRDRLRAAGYRVLMTKSSPTDRVPLARRAAIANRAHAALAVSIHDQAGSDGGIGFATGNNIVYYQPVGGYRQTPSGRRVVFTSRALSSTSLRCAEEIRSTRSSVEHHPVTLRGTVGYDLGSRGLAPGDMWMVQLLATVPWIYNEAGGNSAGRSGLDSTDRARYAAGLVAGIQRCVPIHR